MTHQREWQVDIGSVRSHSLLVLPDGDGPHPAVLIFPQWSGRSEAEEQFAHRLAALGYAAVACDLYGDGKRGSGPEENQPLMQAFLDDRGELRARLTDIAAHVARLDEVDGNRVAAAGFCLGGLCAIDLARSGADVRACASFHGIFGRPEGLEEPPIKATVALYHGWDDPLAPPADVVAVADELTKRKADWYIVGFGHALHSFTSPAADNRGGGVAYDAAADQRSWADFTRLLEETLG